MVSFEPDRVEIFLDGKRLELESGQKVAPHGVDRGLDVDEILQNDRAGSASDEGNTGGRDPARLRSRQVPADSTRSRSGSTLDVDYAPAPDFRVVQLTPPGSSTRRFSSASG